MTSDFEQDLGTRLTELRNRGLLRELRQVSASPGRMVHLQRAALLNFGSNDYLGLADAPALKEASREAVSRFGAGASASRLICGSLQPHHALEEELACFKNTPAAITFSSGYAAALGTICAVAGKGDVLILDRLVHACIVDAARLSGATIRIFAHNDLVDLEEKLKWARQRRNGHSRHRVLIVTESVFSMDGDQAPLRNIVALKEKYGAWLMLDEAHATGLFGEQRSGLAEALNISDGVEVQMGTLGKALGSAGGYVCGSRNLVDFLVNSARSFIFSTAPVPAAAAAATAGIRMVRSAEGAARRDRLWENVSLLFNRLDWPAPPQSAIVPVPIGNENDAVATSTAFRERGLFAPAVRYPSVQRGRARLRLSLSASHTSADVLLLAGNLHLLCPAAVAAPQAQSVS